MTDSRRAVVVSLAAQFKCHLSAASFSILTFAFTLVATLATPELLAGSANTELPVRQLLSSRAMSTAVANAAFAPAADALAAAPFAATLRISQAKLQSAPALVAPVIDRRDARLFPELSLELFSDGDLLIPVQRGRMLREQSTHETASYWRVIPQWGRVWREPGDGEWSRAALPLTLVNDTENHAHQGVATFLYRKSSTRAQGGGEFEVSALAMQFTQQTAPYLLRQHFILWGQAALTLERSSISNLTAERTAARREFATRLPTKPWSELAKKFPNVAFDGFGLPLVPKWQVLNALVHDGTLYHQESATPQGPYPYPLEMRFGVRSVMKSIAAPLGMLHLAQVYGPYVLDLRIGDYLPGLDPKFARIRFIDAANMATGFGGTGSFQTHPNNPYDGYLDADYDAWYTAGSMVEKMALISRNLKPYPWEPGTVMRYRDQDYFLLGAALDAFLKSVRGADADLWSMLTDEVFKPIGIHQAPAVRTREADGRDGLVWANAGYYPSLDDLAKIALLVQREGMHDGKPLLHRRLTRELLAARGALDPTGESPADSPAELYRSGFWFPRYTSRSGKTHYLPSMQGSGENRVTLYPNGIITLQMGKAAQLPEGERALTDDAGATHRIVDQMLPF